MRQFAPVGTETINMEIKVNRFLLIAPQLSTLVFAFLVFRKILYFDLRKLVKVWHWVLKVFELTVRSVIPGSLFAIDAVRSLQERYLFTK